MEIAVFIPALLATAFFLFLVIGAIITRYRKNKRR